MRKVLKSKFIMLGIAFIMLVFFTNDFGIIDIEKTAIITAVGIDKAEEEYEITVQIAVPEASNANAVNNKAVVSAKGGSTAEAIHQIGDITGWYPKLAFCNLIIFGENMLTENIKALLDYFARTFKIQDSACVSACEGTAKKLLQSATPLDNISSFAVQKILLKNRGMTSDVATTDIKTFSVGYYSRTSSGFLPQIKMIKVSGDETSQKAGGGDTAGKSSESGGSGKENHVFDASKTILFKNGVAVGSLDSHETKAFNLLRESVVENIFYVDDVQMNEKTINAVLTIMRNDCSVKLDMDGATPMLKIKADIFCRLEDTTDTDRKDSLVSNVFIPKEVCQKAEEEFTTYVNGIVEKCKKSGCDLFKLDEKLYRCFNKYYDAISGQLYDILQTEIQVNFRGLK